MLQNMHEIIKECDPFLMQAILMIEFNKKQLKF